MFLKRDERVLLQLAAKDGIEEINVAIAKLRRGNPAAFHDGDSLRERVFLVQPANWIPCQGSIRPAPTQSPRKSD
ncbi:hypothetical protein [Paraburkholderia sediminicola]|uniref:hypothetical protein n=1 Tax=Paraburkholderia sediminicola TaxID=458836 RepID=UPI0038B73050